MSKKDEIFEEMKRKGSKKSIAKIEAEVDKCKRDEKAALFEMTKWLFFLERSGRWRENKIYKKSSWIRYLNDRFMLREGTYIDMKNSFFLFPDMAMVYGPGLVSKVITKDGAENALAVFDKIKNLKKPTRDAIERIIDANAKPAPPISKETMSNLRAENSRLKEEIRELKEEIKGKDKQLREKDEQIKKLKETMRRLNGEKLAA